ncbi:uncharacterized protein LOC143286907 isoform X2 [Babylonia areolata]
MGVYDHMMRPSMGHRLQTELRDSMERYHSDKDHLQHHLAQLRLRSKDLHTTSSTPQDPPSSPVKRWGDPNSSFSQAPEVAAHRAQLAQMEHHPHQAPPTTHVSNASFLPPIQQPPTQNTQSTHPKSSSDDNDTPRTQTMGTPAGAKATPVQGRAGDRRVAKGRKTQKKAKPVAVKKWQKDKTVAPMLMTLPTIPSASGVRRSVWDSGLHHLPPHPGPGTHLERNQVEEECRHFSQRSRPIPAIDDAKRTEIQRPPWLQLPPGVTSSTKVQFRRHPPPPAPDHQQGAAHSTSTDHPSPKPTVDHFPHHAPRLPELDEGSTEGEEESDHDGTAHAPDGELGQQRRIVLPSIPASTQLTKSSIPPLRLRRRLNSSANSAATAQSGATYMSLMSQETQEWKGIYVQSEDPRLKGRMLMEILHATRQRMHDNEEDLRLAGDLPQPHDPQWGADVMLLHRDSVPGSGATTARASQPQKKPFKLPHHLHKKRAADGGAAGRSHNAKLHRYLSKLSHQRKGGGEQRPQLAAMTIREITQSSLEHQSAVHTAS